jgi:hypothetical protein
MKIRLYFSCFALFLEPFTWPEAGGEQAICSGMRQRRWRNPMAPETKVVLEVSTTTRSWTVTPEARADLCDRMRLQVQSYLLPSDGGMQFTVRWENYMRAVGVIEIWAAENGMDPEQLRFAHWVKPKQ